MLTRFLSFFIQLSVIPNLCIDMSDSSRVSRREASRSDSLSPSKLPKVVLKPPTTPIPSNPKPSRNRFFVAPPRLPSAQKRQYKHINETVLNIDSRTRVDEVIGEYLVGDTLYYYARYDGGIAYKVC